MGIYLPNMEMPKEGSWVTFRLFPDGKCVLYSWCGNDFDFMEHLTAAPVPPHGDLIDKKNLSDDLQRRWNVSDDQDFCNKEVWHALEEAPTIIEAEEET